jgi:ketosteroid isomerase-like protein
VASPNVDLVRSIYTTWWGEDLSSAEWVDPDIEFGWADGPSPGPWKGIDEVAQGWRDFLSTWDEYRVEVEDCRELDDERVLVLTRRTGRGKTSGIELGHIRPEGAAVFHVRSGKVTKFIGYFDRDRALADLGLAPEAESPRP